MIRFSFLFLIIIISCTSLREPPKNYIYNQKLVIPVIIHVYKFNSPIVINKRTMSNNLNDIKIKLIEEKINSYWKKANIVFSLKFNEVIVPEKKKKFYKNNVEKFPILIPYLNLVPHAAIGSLVDKSKMDKKNIHVNILPIGPRGLAGYVPAWDLNKIYIGYWQFDTNKNYYIYYEIEDMAWLISHELGHSIGLGHKKGTLMSENWETGLNIDQIYTARMFLKKKYNFKTYKESIQKKKYVKPVIKKNNMKKTLMKKLFNL